MDVDDSGRPRTCCATGRPGADRDVDEAAARAWAGGDAERRAALRAVGTRSAMVVPIAAGDRASARDPRHRRTPRAGWARPSWSWPTSSGGAPASRWRTRACTPSARRSPPRCSAACCRRACPRCPGVTIAALFRAAGEATEVGGDFYDVFRGRRRVDGRHRRRDRQGARGGHDHVAGPLHDAHRGDVRALARRRARAAERGARRRPRAPPICTAVCARIEPAADGTLLVTLACGGHPPPFLITTAGGAETVGTPGPLLGAFDGGVWEERHATLAAATRWSSTPTASPTPAARTASCSARTG